MARQKWQEWAQNQDNLAILTAWARAGLTDAEIAKQIGISRSTLSEWKKKNDNIRQALSTGKEYADRLVENSLFRMTQGYEAKKRKAIKLKRVEFDEKGRRAAEDERMRRANAIADGSQLWITVLAARLGDVVHIDAEEFEAAKKIRYLARRNQDGSMDMCTEVMVKELPGEQEETGHQ